MNLGKNIAIYALFFSLGLFIFCQLGATPQAVSFWKNKNVETGQVIIFHDHHLLPDENKQNFLTFENMLEKIKSGYCGPKAHVIIESAVAGLYSDVIIECSTLAGTDSFFLSACKKFLDQLYQNDIISCCNVEFRNIRTLIQLWLSLNLAYKNGKQVLPLLQKVYDICEKITFEDLYKDQVALLKRYENESQEPFQKIFNLIHQKVTSEINRLQMTLIKHGINEKTPITEYCCDQSQPTKALFLTQFIFSNDYSLFLSDMIEAHALYHIMGIPADDLTIIVVGFVHAQELEKYIQQIGYACVGKISSTYGSIPISSYAKCLLQSNSCYVCCKQDANSRCSVCKVTKYCSAECQRKDWKDHKKICINQ